VNRSWQIPPADMQALILAGCHEGFPVILELVKPTLQERRHAQPVTGRIQIITANQ